MKMSEIKNLFQRINAIRDEVAYIQKDKSVSTGSGSYKAVTHDMVTAVTRASLIKHGVISWPSLVISKMNDPIQLEPAKVNKQYRYDATYDFTFANCDKPEETIVIRIEAHAMDNADKAPGKALSYAKKYALLKLLDIETGEDEESRVPDEFDIQPYMTQMESAKTLAELNAAHKALLVAANGAMDKATEKVVIQKKNALAKVLTANEPLSDDRFQRAIAAIKSGETTKEKVMTYALTESQRKDLEAMQ